MTYHLLVRFPTPHRGHKGIRRLDVGKRMLYSDLASENSHKTPTMERLDIQDKLTEQQGELVKDLVLVVLIEADPTIVV